MLGDWWDPDAGEDPSPRTVARARGPAAPSRPRPPVPAPADPVHVGGLSRWWRAGQVAPVVLAVAAGATAVALGDLWWAVLAATQLGSAALLVRAAARLPVRVEAGRSGLEVVARRGRRHVAWERLREVRGTRAVGTVPVDTHLELDTGELVALPRRTPGGWVEVGRERCGGARPVPGLPQEWRATWSGAPARFSAGHNVLLLVALVLPHTVRWGADALALHPAVLLSAYTVVLWLLALVSWRAPVRPVVADEHGLSVPGWRRTRRTAWAQVEDVRAKGRYDPEVVLDLGSAGTQELVGPDVDRVRGWWRLATGVDRPGAAGLPVDR